MKKIHLVQIQTEFFFYFCRTSTDWVSHKAYLQNNNFIWTEVFVYSQD